jgi:hypothetical protein
MSINAEIRTLKFNTGVDLAIPPIGDLGNKTALTNNSANTITALTFDLADFREVGLDLYVYRKITGGYRWMKVWIDLIGIPDGATNADKWQKWETSKKEKDTSTGVTFSLDTSVANKCTLVATLDNQAGTDCNIYWKLHTKLV